MRGRMVSGIEYHGLSETIPGPLLGRHFAFVATHNHFVLDRGGKVFNRSAPVIKLPEGATEDDHLELLGILNSSTACFWLKQVSHDQGNGAVEAGLPDTLGKISTNYRQLGWNISASS